MKSVLRCRSNPNLLSSVSPQRISGECPLVKWSYDRGLDHAIEREKHLRSILNTKNLIKSEPAKSLPLSAITENKHVLQIPFRPIEFIRKHPYIFEEYFPGGIRIHPHIKLRQQVLELDAEEELVYQSDSYRLDVATRLVKLLMISRMNTIPIQFLNLLKFDLGLPPDYDHCLIGDFPDFFRIVRNRNASELELVFWNNELAVSCMEKKAKTGNGFAYPIQFSKDLVMDSKNKKDLDDWQKLPYLSPYENATNLEPTSDESDKWTVGVLHEILNLFVSKKTERDVLLAIGEWLGIRSRCRRALLRHHGIFYSSFKWTTSAVVLKEAYKRGSLIEHNQLAVVWRKYAHLMNKALEPKHAIEADAENVDNQKADSSNEDDNNGGNIYDKKRTCAKSPANRSRVNENRYSDGRRIRKSYRKEMCFEERSKSKSKRNIRLGPKDYSSKKSRKRTVASTMAFPF